MSRKQADVSRREQAQRLYEEARERNELVRQTHLQTSPSSWSFPNTFFGGVFDALLQDFAPDSNVKIFCGDRAPQGEQAEYSTTALCIRGLLPMAKQAGPLLDRALCCLLSLYIARVRSDAPLDSFAGRLYVDTLGDFQRQLARMSFANMQMSVSSDTPKVLACVSIALQLYEVLPSITANLPPCIVLLTHG